MTVALVQCPAWGILPPLGLAALKAHLGAHGIDATIIDLNVACFHEEQRVRREDPEGAYGGTDPWGAESYDEWGFDDPGAAVRRPEIAFLPGSTYRTRPLPIERWADEILALDPEVVGFSIYITSLTTSLFVAREIKRRRPDVVVVFGGPHVAQDQSGDVTLRCNVADVVVDGEGEETFLELVQMVRRGERDFTGVAGAGTLVRGRPRWGPKRPLIKRIDDLPIPDFSDVDWTQYSNPYLIPIMSSRGCVLDCAFCYETVYWKRYRTQSPQRIVDEIAHQVANHPLREQAEREGKRFYFMFADSLVNGHLGGLRRFAELLVAQDLPVDWGGQATINTKMDEAFFDLLGRAGCLGLAFGLESGSQRVLESMGKHFHIDDAAEFIRQSHLAGVTVTANIMVGYPNETRRDFLETLRFLARTRRWLSQVSNVTTTQIALGSELHSHPERYGVTVHADGSWTSKATGDEFRRERRLYLLHRWMQLLGIDHQEVATSHRADARRRRRARRRAQRSEARRAWVQEQRERFVPPGPSWQLFDTVGPGPRTDPPPWPAEVPLHATLAVALDGSVAVERWSDDATLPFDRHEVLRDGMDLVVARIEAAYPEDRSLDRPDPEDHELVWVEGIDEELTAKVLVAVVPSRDAEGKLTGLRSSIGVVPYDPDDPSEIPFTVPVGVGATAAPVEISIRPTR